MIHLTTFILSVFMAYTIYAQSPVNWPNFSRFLSSPYYYAIHQVLPTQQNAAFLHQNSDQSGSHSDPIMSAVLQQLKETSKRLAETNIVVENMKNEMTDLKNELAQLKKSVEEKDKAESLKNESNETKMQTEMLTTDFERFTFNSSNDREIPTARHCSCNMVVYIIDRLTKELDDTKFKLESLTTQFKVSISPTTIDKEPTSCADLKQLGYAKSGIFSIKGTNQVENVYCDFMKSNSPTDFQKWIGIADVKSIRVHFHAQRGSPYTTADSPIPFELFKSNVGNAMDETTSIFDAPVTGTYFFGFVGLTLQSNQARVELQHKTLTDDWFSVGRAYGSVGYAETYAMQATIRVSKGDQIRLYLRDGKIYDADSHNTNFVGFLLEEELVF